MKRFLIFTFCFLALATAANAQTFTSTATITISRKSDGAGATQNKADRALMEDIERYVVGVAGAVVNPTEKSGGVCQQFRYTIGSKSINLEIYNRDASTCAVLILGNGKRDLRPLAAAAQVKTPFQRHSRSTATARFR